MSFASSSKAAPLFPPGEVASPAAQSQTEWMQMPLEAPAPTLGVTWESRRSRLAENFRAFFRDPAPPGEFLGDPYFRDCWVAGRFPRRAFSAAIVWHAVAIVMLVHVWGFLMLRPSAALLPRTEITWYGPADDLPLIAPKIPAVRSRVRPAAAPEEHGAQAFHPRQTILNRPIRPNHPRQTLIEPQAPPEPPKLLPPLPNIVAWNDPAKPQLRINPSVMTRPQAKPIAQPATQANVAAPNLTAQGNYDVPLNVSTATVAKPLLPVGAMKARVRTTPTASQGADASPPELSAGDLGNQQLIALSATPDPTAPPLPPVGNLSSEISISPEGRASGARTAESGPSGSGPAGLTIAGGEPRANVSGVGRGVLPRAMPGVAAATASDLRADSRPDLRADPPPARLQPAPLASISGMNPSAPPEQLLGGKQIYTLNVSMPNMTSAMGSWVLRFAELNGDEIRPNTLGLSAPEPLRKVDPKYPPELRTKHVEGEVVLFAVIRADGTVDSIQLVAGVDPQLDNNAMQALALWKFRPAERNGQPVELAAIVHIPFHAAVPAY